jgi:hypothetical protein
MATLTAIITGRAPILELDEVPSAKRTILCQMTKADGKKAFELAFGCNPGTADRFPVGGATLR